MVFDSQAKKVKARFDTAALMRVLGGPGLLLRFIGLVISFGLGIAASAQPAQTNSLVEGNTAFALDLYGHLSKTPGNVFFSPFSISTCLAMTYAGARSDTKMQMRQVLRFNQNDLRLHSSFSELQQRLIGTKEERGPQLTALSPELLAQLNDAEKQKGMRLEIANALWTQKGEPFLPAFLNIAANDYQADLKQADFKTDADAVMRQINGWVAQKTVDKIQNILLPDDLDASSRLVLVNAIYFKDNWSSPFKKAATSAQPFHLSTNSQVKTSLMLHWDNVNYTENDDLQALELPYIGEQSMVILLPRQIDGVAHFESQLNPACLDHLLAQMTAQRVRIELPRFKLESRFELEHTLPEMGMTDAFIAQKADFSGINGVRRGNATSLYISHVIHKAWIEVTEEGTEAAAATALSVAVGSAAPQAPRLVFRADHPFIFLIRDRISGSLLFIGRMADPRGV
jgi:serpin B